MGETENTYYFKHQLTKCTFLYYLAVWKMARYYIFVLSKFQAH